MKLTEPENKNYAAVICRVNALHDLEGLDNLAGVNFFGYQCLTEKAKTTVGDLVVVFPPEVQLSEEFARVNNLFRHSDRNDNPDESGYLEDNRRVRAIKLRGHASNCMMLGLSSLAYTGFDVSKLEEGDTFDKLNGHEICRKYVVKEPGVARMDKNKIAKFRRVDNVAFPLHADTDNYWRNSHSIPDDQLIFVSQKLHGTSVRFGKIKVARELKWYERALVRLGIKIQKEQYGFVTGSRRVIKSILD